MSVRLQPSLDASGDTELWDALPIAVLQLKDDGSALFGNRAWCGLTGRELEAREWFDLLPNDKLTELLPLLAEARAGDVEVPLKTSRGQRWTRWMWTEPPPGDDTRLVVVLDVTADRTREQRLTARATQDSLTGVTNRGSFLELVDDALQDASAPAVSVVYADLDGFKQVNDSGGHALGDQVLCLVSERLRQHLRSTDTLGRVGGDEFAVLCTGPEPEVQSVAKRVAEAFDDPFIVNGKAMQVGATIGVAIAAQRESDAEALLARADQAMYAAKRSLSRITASHR